MSVKALIRRGEEIFFLEREKERATKLEASGAARPARQALRRLDVAEQLAASPATRASAWSVVRDARRLAVAARRAAGKDDLEETDTDRLLEDETVLFDTREPHEAPRLLAEAAARVRELLAGIEPRTVREIVFEQRLRAVTMSVAIGLAILLGYRFVSAPKNLTHGATVMTDLRLPLDPNPLVNGILEDRTWALTRVQTEPSVLVDLNAPHRIRRIVVYGRGDREPADFLPLVVEVSSDAQHFQAIGRRDTLFTAFVPWVINTNIAGVRYVRLRSQRYGTIALAELEVSGY